MNNADSPNTITRCDRPLVSVLIPTYNCADYVGQAIDSVLAQDYQPIEVLVADDGSTDHTQQVLQRYQRQVQILTLTRGGVGAARNAMLAAAQGQFIAILDADDLYCPGKISAQVQAMSKRSEVGLCHTAYQPFGGDDLVPPEAGSVARRYQGRCFQQLFDCHEICWGTVMIRRRCVPPHGFYQDMPLAEDYAFMLSVLHGSEAAFLPEVYYRYRRRATQVTAGNRQRWPIYEGLARLRVLDQLGFQVDRQTAEKLRGLALERLEQTSYDRYWRGDYGWAHLGFGVLNQYGRKIPFKHRFRAAWQRYLCAPSARPKPVRTAVRHTAS